jgi:DNA-binding NtrC family response regulator
MSNGNILVIDDEAGQRESMQSILGPAGYIVLEASDYEEALSVQKRHAGELDLALVDLRLPGGNGYDLAKALLAFDPRLKLVFTSGQAGSELCRFIDMPVTDLHFLKKPFTPDGLLQRVKSVLELAAHAAVRFQTAGA